MVHHGFNRATEGIDLFYKVASNIALLKKEFFILTNNAVIEVIDIDIEEYGFVRVADEVVVDLMVIACGIELKLQSVKSSGMNYTE